VHERDGLATARRVTATPHGLEVGSADDDPDLPGVAVVRAGRPAARVVAYKPGQSCVLGDGGPVMWKVFPPAGFVGIVARWTTVHDVGSRAGVRVPAVRVLDAAAGVLEMETLTGRRLREAGHDTAVPPAERAAYFEQLGGALAALARAGAALAPGDSLPGLPVRRLLDDAGDVLDGLPTLVAVDPSTARTVERLTARLAAGPDPVDAVPAVVAHGALRPDQVLLGSGTGRPDDGIALVDLDGACRSAPERDLANLTAYLWWRGVRRPGERDEVATLAAAATAGAIAGGLDRDRGRFDRLLALALLKVATRRYRALDTAEWPLVPHLVAEAARLAGDLP